MPKLKWRGIIMRTAIRYRDQILDNFYLNEDGITIHRKKDCVRKQFKEGDIVETYQLKGNKGNDYRGIHIPSAYTTISLPWLLVVLRGLVIEEDSVIDHISGDITDNSKENLRVCTQSVNSRNCKKRSDNTSGYVGLSFHKPTGRFVVRRTIAGTRVWKSYPTKQEAIVGWEEVNKLAKLDGYTERHGK